MKLLLIGPYPPPHGGISVHVAEAKRQLDQAGVCCRVLNLSRAAPESEQYLRPRGKLNLLYLLLYHARDGWTLHLHTNGHNGKSWLVALVCGLIGQFAPSCLLTVHSGMAPSYLHRDRSWQRRLARLTCRLYDRVIAVNRQIWRAILSLEISPNRLEVIPAYLSTSSPAALPAGMEELVRASRPLLSTVLFFRPEYGFELLAEALRRLRSQFPNLLCLVMGSGEDRGKAERMIQEAELEGTVKLLGDVPHELCLGLISASDLFVRATMKDGDSISVREALSLGIPTVVSDVGHRPWGARLFRAGDLEDLVAQMGAALAAPRRTYSPVAVRPAPGGTRRLLEVYSGVAVRGAQPCS